MVSANKPAPLFHIQGETSRTISPNHLENSAAWKRTDLTLFPAVRFYKLIDFSDSLSVGLNHLSESAVIYSLN